MIRWAEPSDVGAIVRCIRELAEFEKLAHACRAEPERLATHLFSDPPACEALVAVDGSGEVVGFALFFAAYSTFECGPYLWLEDLYVTPAARGQGHGRELLRTLAAIALERGWRRCQWQVLDWNERAIAFYERLGARLLREWLTCRVEGDGLAALAAGAKVPARGCAT